MLGQIITIARNTFVESVRQPIYFVLIVLCGIFQVFNTWGSSFSMGYSDSAEVSGDNKLLLDIGLATVFVCGMLLAAFIATAVISREIENKTVLTVVSKPVGRPVLVLGKYLGATGAIVAAVLTMLLFLQMAIRHGVLSTTADQVDVPVVVFSLSAVGLALAAGIWGNFFYGWVFSQTATLLMFPLMGVAWLLVLLIDKDWGWQAIGTDFKAQIAIAGGALVLSQLVLTAVATAASARLGQVMTIVACSGVFVFGLLSNYFVGRHAFQNEFLARVRVAEPASPDEAGFRRSGDTYRLEFEIAPRVAIGQGSPLYYGPNPNGFDLMVPGFAPYGGDIGDREAMFSPRTEPALVVMAAAGREATVVNIGPASGGVAVRRSPEAGDYVFTRPTRVNPAAVAVWGVVPNIQFFWLVDAVTQNQPVPASHLALIGVYTAAQIGVFLALAVVLFQTRQVG